jgi:hypothetical protein
VDSFFVYTWIGMKAGKRSGVKFGDMFVFAGRKSIKGYKTLAVHSDKESRHNFLWRLS